MRLHELLIFSFIMFGFSYAIIIGLDREAQRQACIIYDKELGRSFYNYESPDCLKLID